jgi:hypothetical protein
MPLTAANSEPTLTLPTGRIIAAMLLAAAFTGSAWVGIALALKMDATVQTAGLVGVAIVAVVCVLGLLAITPWKPRPVSTWMTLWLAGTVLRLFATPALTFLLYFAAPLNALAVTLSVALAYLIVLLTETAVIARHVSRVTQPASSH